MRWLVLLPWAALTAHTLVNALLLRRPATGATVEERVAVLLPVRNEAERVGPCLDALLAQDGVVVHVLDDGSTDGTADVVTARAGTSADGTADVTARAGASADGTADVTARTGGKVRLLTGEPLPAGWLGKPHACQQLADDAADADVLCFVDADVVLAPGAVAAAVAELRRAGVALLTPYPKIIGAGRLVQPLLQWSWLTFLPLRAMERSPRPSLAAAGGQWLVVDARAYRRAGGHAAVRAEILEDIALARAVKRSGGRIALADGSGLATCRMYDSWADLTAGYAKSLWASFGTRSGAGAVVVMLLLLYVVPPVAAVVLAATGALTWAAIALTAYALGVAGRAVAATATGGRAWPDALAHPVSIVLFARLVTVSFRLRARGGLTWRGRPV